ncbi:L,D-transpeptidase family protein [Zoogloea sp.]|uniref:L,D-transpeptidase family protein n=1 Tax=Zoogloea sp. TaxID=49181 RepID=UPI0026324CFE|nr:L,D-transpeptidase family protein [Zoogloea sp.]MDD3352820.1 hypothetical protein [Zoogloea sp.]
MPDGFRLPSACRQLLLCLSDSWAAPTGTLQRFRREDDSPWIREGPAIPVSLGHRGMAWGRGLHPPMGGSSKREGDQCAPAGVFTLTALFGTEDADSPVTQAARLPYLATHAGLRCVDDAASTHYNCLVDQTRLAPDWCSAEEMRRADARYTLGAVVAHNTAPRKPGAGSCIFLHVWEAAGIPTAGCTAMALEAMETLARWLDGRAHPLLVQLPRTEFHRLRRPWSLPER